jgi:uncharacterized coiled-coil DUF342 family protein
MTEILKVYYFARILFTKIRSKTMSEEEIIHIKHSLGEIRSHIGDIHAKIDALAQTMSEISEALFEAYEEEDSVYDDFDTEQTWVPEEDEFWKNDNEDDEF